MIKEDWNEMALRFLKTHGWEEECENMLGHESFPMLEDISTKNGALKFAEGFYTKAWKSYKSFIEGSNILIKAKQKELKDNALVLEDGQ